MYVYMSQLHCYIGNDCDCDVSLLVIMTAAISILTVSYVWEKPYQYGS